MDIKLLLQIAGVLLGLLYLWLEYRADIRLWIVGLVMPLIHGALYYKSGLYADCSMQAYYVLAGLYGWLVWRRRGRKTDAGLTGPEDAEGAKRAASLAASMLAPRNRNSQPYFSFWRSIIRRTIS